jgi:hypothetical protein
MMRVLVCGGRKYREREKVFVVLAGLHRDHGPLTVIQGGATGADALAREWCYRFTGRVRMINEPAEWDDLSHPDARIVTRRDGSQYDANAGSRRNQRMIDDWQPDLVVAFPGGSGTADMIRRAEKAGVQVQRVNSSV